MFIKIPKLEANVSIFNKAMQKYDKCPHAMQINGQMSCNIFYYAYDTSFDILHHCSSCKLNTNEPSTIKDPVRNP